MDQLRGRPSHSNICTKSVHCWTKDAKGYGNRFKVRLVGSESSSEDVSFTARPDDDNVNGTEGSCGNRGELSESPVARIPSVAATCRVG